MLSFLAQVIHKLSQLEIGISVGSIDIVALQSTKPALDTYYGLKTKKVRKYATSDRMTVEEIYENVDLQTHLTFDYLMMVCAASMIAAVGLVSDSSVTVVASMLVSPLMGPIVG
jgi:hypothetical protein